MALAGDATRAVFDEELPQLFGSGYFSPDTANRSAYNVFHKKMRIAHTIKFTITVMRMKVYETVRNRPLLISWAIKAKTISMTRNTAMG
jgi:hypothetical protein